MKLMKLTRIDEEGKKFYLKSITKDGPQGKKGINVWTENAEEALSVTAEQVEKIAGQLED